MISGSHLLNNPYESSIQQLLQIEGQKKLQLQNEQQTLESQKKALSDIDSKLSSLNTTLSSFINSPGEQTSPLAATSTTDAIEVISTGGMDSPGSFSVKVDQVAKEDIMLSDTVSATGTDFNATGTGSFDIAIGSEHSATISVDTTGLTNREVMEEIASQVQDQLGDHLNASVLQPENGTAKLSFKSLDTGSEHRISISNQQGDLAGMNFANVNTEAELNAKFTIDGVNFERSSNLIDDAVDGLTFEISKETDVTEKIEVSQDLEEAQGNIEAFIEEFNAANKIIRDKTHLNGETGERGLLQRERNIRNLSFNLRNAATLPVDSLSGSSVNSLRSIGIELAQDGTMSIEDSDQLKKALSENAGAVGQLFSAEDGVAASLQQQINLFVGNDSNVLDTIKDSYDRKIDRLDDRITAEDEYLVRKEEELRAEFAQLDQVINDGQRQFDRIMSFQGQYGF